MDSAEEAVEAVLPEPDHPVASALFDIIADGYALWRENENH